MNNKQKILLVKGVISLSAILGIVMCIMIYILEQQIEGTKAYHFYNTLSIISVIALVISVTVMQILMIKIDIRPERTKSKKLKIKCENEQQVKELLEQKLLNDGYKKWSIFKNYPYDISYTYKKKGNIAYVVMFMKLDEMSEEIYQEYQERRFEQLGNYLLKNGIVQEKNHICVTYIICVNKVTKYFSKYTESNVKQELGRYTLPVGISFGSNTLYIGTQEEGFFKGTYKKMKKQFMKYIDDILELQK